MCGISGILFFEGAGEGVHGERLAAINDTMVHRGPDGDGVWMSDDRRVGLAHRRLAIVDLSPSATQPMANEDGSLHVTYNGEIYNHTRLRRELEAAGHRFRSDHADTEVLLHGFEEWGIEGLVERLEGMFAFALWDGKRREFLLVRDRVGVKPLYFTWHGGSFRFASEIKALLTDPAIPREVEPAAVNHYLSFLVPPAPLTMFRGIFKLPAGHLLSVDTNGKATGKRYWNAVPGQGIDPASLSRLDVEARERFYADGIRKRLEQAVEKRMMADVPFGVFLSGGVDSSANVALMSRLMDRPVETFTVGFSDHTHLNELDYARQVADAFGARHHEVLIDERDMTGYLSDLIHHQDEPIADWVCIPLHFVSKLARDNGVPVVQVGEGSDEQFCGYDSYMAYLGLEKRFWRPYMRLVPSGARRLAANLAKGAAALSPAFDRHADILSRAARDQELFWGGAHAVWNVPKARLWRGGKAEPHPSWARLEEAGIPTDGLGAADSGDLVSAYMKEFDGKHPGRDVLTRMIHLEFRLRLPELLLMRVDKIAMANSVEARVPFLDPDLVSFTMDIPMADKVRGGVSKRLLKRALHDVLPSEILERPKMGFGAPMKQWLQGDFGRMAERTVSGCRLVADGFFAEERVVQLFREHREGRRDHALTLWTLYNLVAWHDHWIA